jgi:hypothetical protein
VSLKALTVNITPFYDVVGVAGSESTLTGYPPQGARLGTISS